MIKCPHKPDMPGFDKISGHIFSAIDCNGKWFPVRINLDTGDTVQLMFGFDLEDDAIGYAMDNFA